MAVPLEEFVEILSDALGTPAPLPPDRTMVDELVFDSLDLAVTVLVYDAVAPGFEFPTVFEPTELTLRDVHHHLCLWMDDIRRDSRQ